MTRIVAFLLLFVNGVAALAQYQFQQLNHVQDARYNGILYQKDVNLHTSVRPLDLWELDSNNFVGPAQSGESKSYSWLRRKLFH